MTGDELEAVVAETYGLDTGARAVSAVLTGDR